MSWEAILPWAFTLLCPLSMLWCMRSMRRQDSCRSSSTDAGAGTPEDPRTEILELRQRLTELEARQAEPAAVWGPRS